MVLSCFYLSGLSKKLLYIERERERERENERECKRERERGSDRHR